MSFEQINIGTRDDPLMVTKHPIIHTPTKEDLIELARELGPEAAAEVLKRREEKIKAEELDPHTGTASSLTIGERPTGC